MKRPSKIKALTGLALSAFVIFMVLVAQGRDPAPGGHESSSKPRNKVKLDRTVKENWWCENPNVKRAPYKTAPVEDPKAYKGWRHPWWTPERSRNISDYLDLDDYVNMDFQDCAPRFDKWRGWKKNVSLLLMLHSNPHPGGRKARDDNRNTWMKDLELHSGVKVVFLLGAVYKHEDQKLLEGEQNESCDLLQFRHIDHYYNATIKTAHAFQYFCRLDWDIIHGPPLYFLRGDDDIYINVRRLLGLTSKYRQDFPEICKKKGAPMIGQWIHNRLSDVRKIKGNFMDKWLIPPYVLDNKIPIFLNGPGFLIPRWGFSCLANAMWKVPLLYVDDMFVSGLLRDHCNIGLGRVKNYLSGDSTPGTKYAIYHVMSDEGAAPLDRYKLHEGIKALS